MTDYGGSTVLKKYELGSDEERNYILGFPHLYVHSNGWIHDRAYTKFSKDVIANIKAKGFTKGVCDLLVEQSANEAVESNSWNFQQSSVKDGYFFPKSSTNISARLEEIKQYLSSKELVSIDYNSSRPGSSGTPIIVQKLYIGRITAISEDKTLITVRVNNSEYRSFRISEIISLADFADKLAYGEMLYLHLTFRPRPKGGTTLTWTTIQGESHQFLAQPFHKDAEPAKKAEHLAGKAIKPTTPKVEKSKTVTAKMAQKPEKKFDDFLLPRSGEVNWSGLEAHLGKFIRVEIYANTVKRETYYFKLESMHCRGDGDKTAMTLRGKDIYIEESLKNLVIASVKRK